MIYLLGWRCDQPSLEIAVLYTRRRMAIGLATTVVDIYIEPKYLHTMGPFYQIHLRATSQTTLSPILCFLYSFHVHDDLTKPFVNVHQFLSLSRKKQRCYTTQSSTYWENFPPSLQWDSVKYGSLFL